MGCKLCMFTTCLALTTAVVAYAAVSMAVDLEELLRPLAPKEPAVRPAHWMGELTDPRDIADGGWFGGVG